MEVSLRDSTYKIERVKFRRWIELGDIRERITKAADVDELASQIGKYLSAALAFPFSFDELTWEESAELFAASIHVNNEYVTLPFMLYHSKDDKPVPYDYEGRSFYHYAHTLAKAYSWNLEYIAELDVDEAFKMIQEILVASHIEREWQWDLSDRAVGWDAAAKKSVHNKLPQPAWMMPVPAEPKIYRIPKSLLPVGNVISFRDAKPD